MKKLWFIVSFIVLLLIMVGCCTHDAQVPNTNLINHLNNSTVTLVGEGPNGKYFVYCGAVWINEITLITAKHCVEDEENPKEKVLGKIITYQTYKEYDKKWPYFENEKTYKAKVIALGDSIDVAVLETEELVEHQYVSIHTGIEIPTGTPVHVLGHPVGLQFSYTQGLVNQNRLMNVNDHEQYILHLSTSGGPGSSGSGAFSPNGHLLGIASFLTLRAPTLLFYVHCASITEFLDKENILYYRVNDL